MMCSTTLACLAILRFSNKLLDRETEEWLTLHKGISNTVVCVVMTPCYWLSSFSRKGQKEAPECRRM